VPRSGIAGSYGSSIFRFLKNLHTDVHSGCTSLHSYQQWIRVPFPSDSSQYFLFVSLLIVILTGVKWNLSVVLIFISFLTKNVEHFFMCSYANCICFESCLYNSLAHLLVRLFFWYLIFGALYIFCLLIPNLMNSWQRFSPNLWVVSWFW
jgi:hypothetical protein